MAKSSSGYWGIDIGQCALKAVRLEMQDGRPVATAYDYIEHPKILSQPDADPDALVHEALAKFLERNPPGKDQLAVSVPGQSGLVRFVKLPPVEEKKIPEIVKFEAKQQIPFPLDEVVWDFQRIAGGEAVGGFAMETEVGLFAMKRDVIARSLAPYSQQNPKPEVHLVQMAPLALCNFATYEVLKKGGPDPVEADGAPLLEGEEDDTPRGKRRCAVVLDIGTDGSNLIITDGGKVVWQRPVPLGGNHFTRALTKEMKLTFAKAEHLKRNAAKSPELTQILKALRPVLTEFVQEVQRSLGFFTNTHRDAHVAYMVGYGNAFRLPGLQKYLSDKLSLDVRKPSRLERISGEAVLADPNFSENLLTFPVALGLALQGVGAARLQTNLLPQEIRVERLVRAKKPWAAAAAASLLLGSGVVGLGYSAQLNSAVDPAIAGALNKGTAAVNAAKSQDGERTKREGEVANTQAEVKTIITGNDERLNWVRLNEVLITALPRHGPDGNLQDADQVPFWSGESGLGDRALAKYKQRMGEGIPLEKIFDDDLSQYLAQVNLESIYCRWAETPATFFTNADTVAKERFGLTIAADMKPEEREEDPQFMRSKPKPPAEPGWVFELRGYTYHEAGSNFLRKCMLRNIQKIDAFAKAPSEMTDEKGKRVPVPGDAKVGTVIPGGVDPILGKISHVFLLLSQPDANPTPGRFKFIDKTWIDTLINPAPAAGAPGAVPTGVPGAAAGGTIAGWVPLFGEGARLGAAAVTFSGGGSEGEGGVGAFLSDPGAAIPAPVPAAGGPPGSAAALANKNKKTRYEFVVCFYWKEPSSTATPVAGP